LCKKERAMRFEESYDMQSMFADDQTVHEIGLHAAEIGATDRGNSKNSPKAVVSR
jgi:hypothetical protein